MKICTFLFFSSLLHAFTLWMPISMTIDSAGLVSYKFPFPVKAAEGAPYKEFSPSLGSFSPVPMLEVNKFRRIFAVEGYPLNQLNADAIEQNGLFLPANSSGGYRVIEKMDYSIGLNLSESVKLVTGWVGLGVNFGVGGTFGKGFLSNRFVPSLKAAKSLKTPNVPTNLKELQQWHPGDSLSTSHTKSVIFNVGTSILGSMGVSISVVGNISSQWNVGIFKPEHEGSQVKLVWAKEKSAKSILNVGNLAGKIVLTKAWGESETFSYLFDLSSQETLDIPVKSFFNSLRGESVTFEKISVITAYQEALKGNLIFADAFSQVGNSGITKLLDEKRTIETSTASLQITLPLLASAITSKGKKVVSGRTRHFDDNHLLEEYFASYSHESSTEGIFTNNMKRISIFTGNFQEIMPLNDPKGDLMRRYSASYKYYYVKNNVTRETLKNELKRIRYRIGMMRELKWINLPRETIPSLEIDLDLSLSNYATDELMKLLDIYPEDVLVTEALNYVTDFFKTEPEAKQEICKGYKIRVLKECIFTTKRQTKAAMLRSIAALKNMRRLRTEADYLNFVQAYGEFGKGLIENRFTLKTFLRFLRQEYHLENGKGIFGKVRMIEVDGHSSRIPFEITLVMKGTNFAPIFRILYSYKFPEDS